MMKNKRMWLLMFIMVFAVALVPSVQSEAAVKLNKKKMTLYVGETATLKVNGTTKKVKWSSSNKKVATVSSTGKVKAKVKAKKQGNATITAKIGKKKYKCKVTVKNKKVGVLSNTSISLEYPNSYRLSLSNATATKWTSSDTEVVTVNNDGTVTAVKAGTATVTCYDSYNNTYSCTVNVTYPNINIKPVSTVYQTVSSTRYYYMKILVTNNTSSQIKINQAAMIYAYGSTSEVMLANDSDSVLISSTNEIIIDSGSNTYIYGFEGKTPYTLYSSGLLGLIIEYKGFSYIVITDSTGKIVSMNLDSE